MKGCFLDIRKSSIYTCVVLMVINIVKIVGAKLTIFPMSKTFLEELGNFQLPAI